MKTLDNLITANFVSDLPSVTGAGIGAELTKKERTMDEKIKTPRGTFRFKFDSLEQAKAEGFTLWFTHNGIHIVGNGTQAFAVKNK